MTLKTHPDETRGVRDAETPAVTRVLIPEARTRRRRRLSWMGAVVALLVIAVVAVLASSVTPRRVRTSTTSPQPAAATCAPSALVASFDGVDSGLAGSILVGFQIQNRSASTCTVQGHPTALFWDARGLVTDLTVQRMGAIVRGRTVSSSPLILLRPGGRAYVNMIEQGCTGRSPGPFTSIQLILHGAPVPGVVTVGRGRNQPFGIGSVCPPKDPGTYPAFSPLEPDRHFI